MIEKFNFKKVFISGYPSYVFKGDKKIVAEKCYFSEAQFDKDITEPTRKIRSNEVVQEHHPLSDLCFRHTLETSSGQSGSLVYAEDKHGEKYCLGVHVGGTE